MDPCHLTVLLPSLLDDAASFTAFSSSITVKHNLYHSRIAIGVILEE
jgi:hypothetical protein